MHQSDDLQDQNTDYTAWIAFGFMTVCLSLSFVFVKLSLEAFTLEQAAGGRLVLGAAFLLPITYLLGDGLPLKFEFWKWAFILGIFNFVFPIGLTTYGLQTIPSNVVGSMYAMVPLITIGLSALVLKVQISRQKSRWFDHWIGGLAYYHRADFVDWYCRKGKCFSYVGYVLRGSLPCDGYHFNARHAKSASDFDDRWERFGCIVVRHLAFLVSIRR